MRSFWYRRALRAISALAIGFVFYLSFTRDAAAIPSFARKYKTGCTTCHTVYPMLNPFGEAFRRNGYRFPSSDGSVDGDATKAEMLELGREPYEKVFPKAVWPDAITDALPLSAMVNGGVAYVLPKSDAYADKKHAFTWDGILEEVHLYGGGAFNNTLTYFAEVTLAESGVSLEHGYLLWGDIVGPRHLVNLWIGRLVGPSLTSFGKHSSYLADSLMPETSLEGLYNPSG